MHGVYGGFKLFVDFYLGCICELSYTLMYFNVVINRKISIIRNLVPQYISCILTSDCLLEALSACEV